MLASRKSELNGGPRGVLGDVEGTTRQRTRTSSQVVQRRPRTLSFLRALILAVLSGFLLTSAPQLQAQTVTATVTAGICPDAVAINPVTNKIYVANYNSGDVTVIDGATNTTATVTAGTHPWAVAVNPVTDKIYVTNRRQRHRHGD